MSDNDATRVPPYRPDYDLLQFLGEQAPLNSLKQYLTYEGQAILHSLNFYESAKLAKWWKKIEAKHACTCTCNCHKR